MMVTDDVTLCVIIMVMVVAGKEPVAEAAVYDICSTRMFISGANGGRRLVKPALNGSVVCCIANKLRVSPQPTVHYYTSA